MKFSIVIPVYNVEKYIDRCLESILKQSYNNFEVIIVDDGSPDDSDKIINRYVKKDNRFKLYKKKNGGLSDARNYGVKFCSGDYLIFIDSDDYVDTKYLEEVNDILVSNNNIDVLKSKIILVDDSKKEIRKEKGFNFNGYVSFKDLVKLEFLEPAWSYVYNLNFFKKNKFKYSIGMLHEDFGLTPEILMKAKNIYYLDYYSYYYVQRDNSIMSSNSREKKLKKAYDMLMQYDRLISLFDDYPNKDDLLIYRSFLANGVISKINTLDNCDRKEFIKELKNRNVVKYLLDDTFVRKFKKIILRFKYGS